MLGTTGQYVVLYGVCPLQIWAPKGEVPSLELVFDTAAAELQQPLRIRLEVNRTGEHLITFMPHARLAMCPQARAWRLQLHVRTTGWLCGVYTLCCVECTPCVV
jgi:hypothetical protein